MFEEADLIHRYTRAQALADGVLIDVTQTAREAGFKYPVALTAAAWAKCVAVPQGVACQDEAGRLWDVLYMLRLAVGRAGGAEVRFAVHVRNDNRDRTPPLVRLKALCGPEDDSAPCITVMMPDEDWSKRGAGKWQPPPRADPVRPGLSEAASGGVGTHCQPKLTWN